MCNQVSCSYHFNTMLVLILKNQNDSKSLCTILYLLSCVVIMNMINDFDYACVYDKIMQIMIRL